MGTGDLDDNEEAEVLIEMYSDSKLISKLLNYYPTERPSEEEEESERRAIEIWKKKMESSPKLLCQTKVR